MATEGECSTLSAGRVKRHRSFARANLRSASHHFQTRSGDDNEPDRIEIDRWTFRAGIAESLGVVADSRNTAANLGLRTARFASWVGRVDCRQVLCLERLSRRYRQGVERFVKCQDVFTTVTSHLLAVSRTVVRQTVVGTRKQTG
jgi:hypothetical protein